MEEKKVLIYDNYLLSNYGYIAHISRPNEHLGFINAEGKFKLKIFYQGKQKQVSLRHLVAEYFIPGYNPSIDKLYLIDNDDPSYCHVQNIEVVRNYQVNKKYLDLFENSDIYKLAYRFHYTHHVFVTNSITLEDVIQMYVIRLYESMNNYAKYEKRMTLTTYAWMVWLKYRKNIIGKLMAQKRYFTLDILDSSDICVSVSTDRDYINEYFPNFMKK